MYIAPHVPESSDPNPLSDFPEAWGLGCDAISCNLAASLSVRASTTGPNTFLRRLARLRLETLARTLFAMSKMKSLGSLDRRREEKRKEKNGVRVREGSLIVESPEFFFLPFLSFIAIGRLMSSAESPDHSPPQFSTSLRSVNLFLSLELPRCPVAKDPGGGTLRCIWTDPSLAWLRRTLPERHPSWAFPPIFSKAAMASSGQSPGITHLVALIKTLTNPQLKDLLRSEGLAVSGVKSSLQLRIIDCSFPSL